MLTVSHTGQLISKHCYVFLSQKGKLIFSLPAAKTNNATGSPASSLDKDTLKQFELKQLSGLQRALTDPIQYLFDIEEHKGLDHFEHLRLAAYEVAKAFRTRKSGTVQIIANGASDMELQALAMGALYADYDFTQFKSKPEPLPKLTVALVHQDAKLCKSAIQLALTLYGGVKATRDLVNTPGSSLTPEQFAKIAQKEATALGITTTVRNAKQLEKEGYMGLITVGKGSNNPPYMVTMEYMPAQPAKSKPSKTSKSTSAVAQTHLGIVGKGITFDTGGISLKPASGMWEMRCDMAGAATALNAILTIARLKLPIQVSCVLVLAENRPGNHSVLPGDIFTAKNGKTVMVDNTDAEGRLVLSDGLAEVQAKGATHVIDLATLTGAIVRAIGSSLTGLFCNDDEFSQSIVQSGRTHGEKFWPMPLEMEYRKSIDDKVADIKNIGGEAGAITAALFLQEFIDSNVKWAHWDIAGTAFHTTSWKYIEHGASGWGVQSLVAVAKSLR